MGAKEWPMPLTAEQRAIGELAKIIAEDPPEFQKEVYAPIRALELRIKAAEEEARTRFAAEQREVAELSARYERLLAALNRSRETQVLQVVAAPPTRWRRLRTFLSDYFTTPY